jgi:hypothetical protein
MGKAEKKILKIMMMAIGLNGWKKKVNQNFLWRGFHRFYGLNQEINGVEGQSPSRVNQAFFLRGMVKRCF